MNLEQVPMFDELPQTDEPKKRPTNKLQEMFILLLEEKKVQLADVQRATGISWGTLHSWYKGDVGTQLADQNLLKLSRYFEVSLEYLCFGENQENIGA